MRTELTITYVVVAILCGLFLATTALAEQERWTLTERLREEFSGHAHYQYSTSFHSLGRTVVVGSVTANLGKGEVRILYDYGSGLKTVMTLVDKEGIIHDGYGSYVRLFERFGALHLTVSATGKNSDGAVFLYKQGSRVQDWILQQTLYPPSDMFVTEYGRSTHYDGIQLLVSAVRRYVSGLRFEVSAINWKGTRYFQEATGVGPMSADPIIIYRTLEGRDNTTSLTFFQVIEDADYTTDFGTSISISGNRMAVGASSRDLLKYGHGTDGLLVVNDVKLLDGAAEYNFDRVVIQNGGILTTERYDTLRGSGGFLNLKIKSELIIEPGGIINMSAAGYEGGPTAFTQGVQPTDGDFLGGGKAADSEFTGFLSCDYDGSSSVSRLQLSEVQGGVARDANNTLPFAEANGGGGGYGTRGQDGTAVQCGDSGFGGNTYGDPLVKVAYRGSGGGSGHPWKIGSGGQGGRGGGVIKIAAKRITNHGIIECNGGNGEDGSYYSGAGGGGSGGSIVIVGENLANYGKIHAKGGIGGERALGSGSGGDVAVRGGHGGDGRIRFDFLATQSFGEVLPHPKNVTTFQGEVYLYERIEGKWTFNSILPRLEGMLFIGHAVALDGTTLAVASDERLFISPTQEVYVMDIRHVQNSSSPIHSWRVIKKPNEADEKFGHGLAIHNQTMVITSAGSEQRRGAVYVHQSRSLVSSTQRVTVLESQNPQPGDGYGSFIHYAFPEIYVQLPDTHDDSPVYSPRRSEGNIHLWKYVTNISYTQSFVTCEYAVITANVTLNCTVNMLDAGGLHVGDLNELPFIHPRVDFLSKGVYTFQMSRGITGPFEVTVLHRNNIIRSFHLTVTNAIVPTQSNVTCTPTSVDAGQPVVCYIYTNRGSGEDIAKQDFDVVVFNMADATLKPTAFDTLTPQGVYRSPPPSQFIQTEALLTDFPTVQPQMRFERHGVYSFTYTPWRAGTFASFIMYKRVALQFPNPVVIDVTTPPIADTKSTVTCPAIGAPHRPLACVVQLRGVEGTPAGLPQLLGNFSNSRYVTAQIGNNRFPVTSVWSGQGRISLLITPNITGTLTVHVHHNNDLLTVTPSTGVDIRNNYAMSCTKMSLLVQSWTMYNQHALGRADKLKYGDFATRGVLTDGIGMCDDWAI